MPRTLIIGLERCMPDRSFFASCRLWISATPLMFVCLLNLGCGSGTRTNAGGSTPKTPPVILVQPANQSVPMGLAATFSVEANGTYPLTYQWMKNGVPIPGATSSSAYTTPATSLADEGEVFSVTVTNSLGSATSSSAALHVTARAPQPGDLRFQQVDAPSTVNGYAPEEGTNLGALSSVGFNPGFGTPLSIGPGCPPDGSFDPTGCQWLLEGYSLPTGSTNLSVAYQYFAYDGLDNQLSSLDDSSTVVTGLDVEQPSKLFAASWVKTTSAGGFDMAQNRVAPGDFQAAASQEGANGRVVTAVSWDNGQIFYLSYGWQKDASTTYDVQVEITNIDGVAGVAQQLANEGYIITATGGTFAEGIVLVGTRVSGDTTPRPMLVVQVPEQDKTILEKQGYAVVGLIDDVDSSGNLLANYWIGER